MERSPKTDEETGKTAGLQNEGLPVPADVPAHGIVTAVWTDRPAVPPENEPQGQPEGQTAKHGKGPQLDAGPKREPGSGKRRA